MGEYTDPYGFYVPDQGEVGPLWGPEVSETFQKINDTFVSEGAINAATFAGLDGRFGAYLSSFEGVNGFHYSHSFGTIVGSGTSANVSSTNSLYSQRIGKRLMLNVMNQRATAGYWANDITTTAYVGASIWNANSRGLVLWDGTENDLISVGNTALGLLGYSNAVRAFLWILFSGTRVEHTDPSFTFPTGTWAAETASAEFSGGTANSSDNAGGIKSAATITYTGTDAVLYLIGRQDGDTVNAVVANGGIAEVRVDGILKATQSLSNQFVKPSGPTTRARGPIAIPLLGMTNGAHTITVTNVGADGTRLTVDCIAPLAAAPPEVLMYRQPYIPPYVNFATAEGVDAFNLALETVVNEFIALNKPVRTVSIDDGFVPATMLSTTQPRHPNDFGSKWYADKTVSLLAQKPFRVGINNL